jgi:hypothetical protein
MITPSADHGWLRNAEHGHEPRAKTEYRALFNSETCMAAYTAAATTTKALTLALMALTTVQTSDMSAHRSERCAPQRMHSGR